MCEYDRIWEQDKTNKWWGGQYPPYVGDASESFVGGTSGFGIYSTNGDSTTPSSHILAPMGIDLFREYLFSDMALLDPLIDWLYG